MTPAADRTVAPGEWGAAARDLHAQGYDYLDLLAGVDRVETIEVLARVVRSTDPTDAILLRTRVAGDRLPSLTAVHPGAAWHERELHELYGVDVAGVPAAGPLLRHEPGGAPPLLKSTVLAARVARTWPGAADAADDRRAARRRQTPPGVAADWLVDGS